MPNNKNKFETTLTAIPYSVFSEPNDIIFTDKPKCVKVIYGVVPKEIKVITSVEVFFHRDKSFSVLQKISEEFERAFIFYNVKYIEYNNTKKEFVRCTFNETQLTIMRTRRI